VLTAPFDIKHWGLVQTEFRLLALREPQLAHAFAAHHARFEESLEPILVEGVRRSGRRLRLGPTTMARLLMAYYKEAVENALLGSSDMPTALDAAHRAMADVIDALTEPV
ncbi:MAG TPA: hypothetical protein PKB06_04580, partial [Actinotalea sp.]|nr:hypothetical protein [Actinotalea sp.]